MLKLVMKYFVFSIVFLLAIGLGTGGLFPAEAQSRMVMSDGGDDGNSGDPNDEQDFNDGSSDDFGDDYEDGYWGAPGGVYSVPVIGFDGQLLLYIPSLGSSSPASKMYFFSEKNSPLGAYNAR